MNYKKIVMSASTIAFVTALVIGGTGAFFSDTETSEANVFTAGSIDLKVDSTQHYNNAICEGGVWVLVGEETVPQYPVIGSACDGTWEETDLGPTNQFFDFDDVKPGDLGENTISLHVVNNDAYACADLSNIINIDNGFSEPEDEVDGPATPGDDGTPDGDLAQNLDFLVWSDNGAAEGHAGNNIWDADEVGDDTSGGAPTTNMSFPLAVPGNPLPGGQTRFLGFAWCAGTFTAGGPGVAPVCDGSTMGNIAQTDKYQADITLRVEQARNNPNFTCEAPQVVERQLVGSEALAYVAPTCDVTVSGDESIQTAVSGAAENSTVCVDSTYDMSGDNVAIRIETLGLTLAAVTKGVDLDVPVVLSNSNVTVTGFDGVIGQAESPAEQAAFYLDNDADGAEISHNTVTGGVGAAVLTETGAANGGSLIANNVFTGAVQGIYTNPHTGIIVIEYNDFVDNVVGVAGLMGATVRYNEFTHTTPASEAIGIDGSFDSNVATINFNNFLNGVKINDYGATAVINAENNFFSVSGALQTTTPADFDITPEEVSVFPHN